MESTLFGLAAAALASAFRRNQAKVRFLIWVAASAKFLIPFELFVWAGAQLRWVEAPGVSGNLELSTLIDQIARPAAALTANLGTMPLASSLSGPNWDGWTILLAIWLAGTAALLGRRIYQWLYLRVVTDLSAPLEIEAPISIRETSTALEPGLFGIFAPTILLSAGIATQLTPAQLAAILEHELCHWRRRDNLAAALHVLVEALFWFHPLVWWLGGRLIAERERACDEAVIQSGNDRRAYAEGILEISRRYVQTSFCSAGVSGGNLVKRMEQIMTSTIIDKLSIAKQCVLAAAACTTIAVPIAVGLSGSANVALAGEASTVEMKHYKSSEWQFELDVPKRWVAMPPVSNNSPFEVMRFMSHEAGNHDLIVFRRVVAPHERIENVLSGTQNVLAKNGFANFVPGETMIGGKRVVTLDFSKTLPSGQAWYCRHYFVVDGTLGYVLGFGTTNPDEMFDLYDRMAKTFVFQAS